MGKLVLLTKYDVTYPSECKKYLFDELPTHRKFNVLGPERVLKMKRIDFGEYSLIPFYEVPLLRMCLALKNFVKLLRRWQKIWTRRGTKKKKLKSHSGIGRGFDNSYFWGVVEKKRLRF
ncbi:uncharacterized protein LOC115982736 isoform X2 [Quercus lobata]|uniref:uncharacterized protein LOC115982736 isoform X2 n=1 Tax=Quercus lobata TaxID=97700 RepID=UPI001248AD09|nr:uncharacterized protein LOC115982736 isoform X2 [Quercus lobata]